MLLVVLAQTGLFAQMGVLFAQTGAPDAAQLKIEDPMLVPAPAAARNVASWQDALALIRDRSTEIEIAHGAVTRALAARRVALAALLPTINASTTATYNLVTNTGLTFIGITPIQTKIPTESYVNGLGQLVQPIIAPRAIYALGTAQANVAAADLSLADTKRNVTLNAANALVSVVTAERVAELNRAGLKSALERLDISTRRQSGGAATGLDVVRAQQDVEAARATLVTGDEQLRQARETLGLALGIPGQIGVSPSFGAQSLEDGTHALCKPAQSLEERTDIAVAREQLVVAKRSIVDAWLQFSPYLTAQSTVATTTINTGAAPNTTWNLQAILSIPIWDGGARYGALRDAHGQVEQAEGNLERTRRVAIVQVAQANRGIEVAQQALEVATRGRDLAVEVDRLVRKGFAEGSGTSLELVTAAAALRQAEINLALKEFDLLRARITADLAVANCEY